MSEIMIRVLSEEDWQQYREVRLAAPAQRLGEREERHARRITRQLITQAANLRSQLKLSPRIVE